MKTSDADAIFSDNTEQGFSAVTAGATMFVFVAGSTKPSHQKGLLIVGVVGFGFRFGPAHLARLAIQNTLNHRLANTRTSLLFFPVNHVLLISHPHVSAMVFRSLLRAFSFGCSLHGVIRGDDSSELNTPGGDVSRVVRPGLSGRGLRLSGGAGEGLGCGRLAGFREVEQTLDRDGAIPAAPLAEAVEPATERRCEAEIRLDDRAGGHGLLLLARNRVRNRFSSDSGHRIESLPERGVGSVDAVPSKELNLLCDSGLVVATGTVGAQKFSSLPTSNSELHSVDPDPSQQHDLHRIGRKVGHRFCGGLQTFLESMHEWVHGGYSDCVRARTALMTSAAWSRVNLDPSTPIRLRSAICFGDAGLDGDGVGMTGRIAISQ